MRSARGNQRWSCTAASLPKANLHRATLDIFWDDFLSIGKAVSAKLLESEILAGRDWTLGC